MGVDRRQIQPVTPNRNALAVASATGSGLSRRIDVRPEDSAACRVERDHFVIGHRRLDDVHDSIHDQRSRFEFRDAVQCADLQHPLQFEILDVVDGDLIEETVTLIEERSTIRQPVLRFLVRVQNSLEWNFLVVKNARDK